MLLLVLALAAVQVGETEVRGNQDAAPEAFSEQVSLAREVARPRFSVAALGGALLLGVSPVPGFGLMAEGGAMVEDRFSLSARLSFFTNIGGWDFGVAVGPDYALSERFAIGVAIALKLYAGLDSPGVVSLLVPLRVTFSPWIRSDHDIRAGACSSGWSLGEEWW